MRNKIATATGVLLAGALLWVLSLHRSEPAVARSAPQYPAGPQEIPGAREPAVKTDTPAATSDLPGTGPAQTEKALSTAPPTDASPDSEPVSGLPPAIVLENMRRVFRQYGSRFGGNPVGTNREITRALNGDNPGHAVFLKPEDGLRINDSGELVDNWGTPFFFHQLSGTDMEIHSAGPDRKMWTPDDLVIK